MNWGEAAMMMRRKLSAGLCTIGLRRRWGAEEQSAIPVYIYTSWPLVSDKFTG